MAKKTNKPRPKKLRTNAVAEFGAVRIRFYDREEDIYIQAGIFENDVWFGMSRVEIALMAKYIKDFLDATKQKGEYLP